MDRESKVCMGCAVWENCPPQKRADRITSEINQGTLSPEQARSEFSRLEQEILRNHCPASERSQLVSPLRKRIHPNRNLHFNTGIVPAHRGPDADYMADRFAANLEVFSRTRNVKARRTTR